MKRRDMLLAGVVAFLLIAFLILVSKAAVPTLADRVARDSARDIARFTPENSVDIAMAMKLVTHAPPSMLNPPKPGPPTLLFLLPSRILRGSRDLSKSPYYTNDSSEEVSPHLSRRYGIPRNRSGRSPGYVGSSVGCHKGTRME